MKQTLKNMRIRKWMGVLFAAVLMTALGAQTALASTDYVKSISITLDVGSGSRRGSSSPSLWIYR